jgi:hypothetical protein
MQQQGPAHEAERREHDRIYEVGCTAASGTNFVVLTMILSLTRLHGQLVARLLEQGLVLV